MAITEERREYLREYYLKNKEKISQKSKKRYLENKEKIIQQQREWQIKNGEKFKQYQKTYNIENKEKRDLYQRKYYIKNKDKILEKQKEYIQNNRERHNAYSVLRYALKTGKITKPDKCSIPKCNNAFSNIEAHHPDYSKPLEVIWCCVSCHHTLYHGKEIRMEN